MAKALSGRLQRPTVLPVSTKGQMSKPEQDKRVKHLLKLLEFRGPKGIAEIEGLIQTGRSVKAKGIDFSPDVLQHALKEYRRRTGCKEAAPAAQPPAPAVSSLPQTSRRNSMPRVPPPDLSMPPRQEPDDDTLEDLAPLLPSHGKPRAAKRPLGVTVAPPQPSVVDSAASTKPPAKRPKAAPKKAPETVAPERPVTPREPAHAPREPARAVPAPARGGRSLPASPVSPSRSGRALRRQSSDASGTSASEDRFSLRLPAAWADGASTASTPAREDCKAPDLRSILEEVDAAVRSVRERPEPDLQMPSRLSELTEPPAARASTERACRLTRKQATESPGRTSGAAPRRRNEALWQQIKEASSEISEMQDARTHQPDALGRARLTATAPSSSAEPEAEPGPSSPSPAVVLSDNEDSGKASSSLASRGGDQLRRLLGQLGPEPKLRRASSSGRFPASPASARCPSPQRQPAARAAEPLAKASSQAAEPSAVPKKPGPKAASSKAKAPARPKAAAREVKEPEPAQTPAAPATSEEAPAASSSLSRQGDVCSVKELKALLAQHNVDPAGCVEKSDLQALWRRYTSALVRPLEELQAACAKAGGQGFGTAEECARFLCSSVGCAASSSAPARRLSRSGSGGEDAGDRERAAETEVQRILSLDKRRFRDPATWGFTVLDVTGPRSINVVQRSYRSLMKKLHPDKVGHLPQVDRAVETLREAKELCERRLSKQVAPAPPRLLKASALCLVRGRRRFRLQWQPPASTDEAPIQRYIVAAFDPAYGKALTITILEPDYNEELRRYVALEELTSFILAEEELPKMPALFQQPHATIQVAAANDAGQSTWATIQVPMRSSTGALSR